MKLRKPDAVYVDAPGARLETEDREGCLRVTLSSDAAVSLARLVWELTPEEVRTEPVRVFSDCWERGYGGEMFTDALPRRLADDYTALMPMFRFLREVYNNVLIERAGR